MCIKYEKGDIQDNDSTGMSECIAYLYRILKIDRIFQGIRLIGERKVGGKEKGVFCKKGQEVSRRVYATSRVRLSSFFEL